MRGSKNLKFRANMDVSVLKNNLRTLNEFFKETTQVNFQVNEKHRRSLKDEKLSAELIYTQKQ